MEQRGNYIIMDWQEFISQYGRGQKFETDQWSRYIITKMLKATHNIDVYETEGNNCLDLIADVDGQTIGIEIKDRIKYKSTAFNDQIIEKIKLDSIRKRISSGQIAKASLFTVFSDSVIAYENNIQSDEKIIRQTTQFCPKTTTLGDNQIIEKELVHYNQTFKVKFELKLYTDPATGQTSLDDIIFYDLSKTRPDDWKTVELF